MIGTLNNVVVLIMGVRGSCYSLIFVGIYKIYSDNKDVVIYKNNEKICSLMTKQQLNLKIKKVIH